MFKKLTEQIRKQIRNDAEETINQKINDAFVELQDKYGIKSGDTTPELEVDLEYATNLLIKSVTEIVEFQIYTNNVVEKITLGRSK